MKIFLFIIGLPFIAFSLSAQDFSELYDYSSSGYNVFKSSATIMHRFHADANLPDGFISVTTVEASPGSGSSPYIGGLMVSLSELNGVPVPGINQHIDFGVPGNLTIYPVSMTYNSNIRKYLIICNLLLTHSGSISQTNIRSYYVLLNEDLSLNAKGIFNFETTATNSNNTSTVGGYRGFFLGDVCPVYGNPNGAHFAIVGKTPEPIGGSGINYTGDPAIFNIGESQIFIAHWDALALNTIDARTFDFKDNGVSISKRIFPSSIIEVNGQGSSSGYFVSGNFHNINTGRSKGLYHWVDYSLNQSTNVNFGDNSSPAEIAVFPSRVRYDRSTDQILVSGTWDNSLTAEIGFFVDKIYDISNTPFNGPIISASQGWPGIGTQQLGGLKINQNVFGTGFCRSGIIYESQTWIPQDPLQRTIGGRLVELALPNNSFINSTNIPTLFEVDFSDQGFSNWLTNVYEGHYYDRPVQSYTSPKHYSQTYRNTAQYYPVHQFIETPSYLSSFCFGGLGLSGSAFPTQDAQEDNRIGIIGTDFYNNNCYYVNEPLTPLAIELDFSSFDVDYYFNRIDQVNPTSVSQPIPELMNYGCPGFLWKNQPNNRDVQSLVFSVLNKKLNVLNFDKTEYSANFSLLDLNGKIIMKNSISKSTSFDLSSFATGVYVLRFEKLNGIIKAYKIFND